MGECEKYDKSIALVGNPNVGKSTLFNELTGLKQHTGNWTGKTVESACGEYIREGKRYRITDLPGTYSLFSLSPEEEVTRDFILSGEAELFLIVCDAACLERNLPLVLQILEEGRAAIIILNLWDEARKYSVSVDTDKLSAILGVPVIKTDARRKSGISELTAKLDTSQRSYYRVNYGEEIEYALTLIPEGLSRFEALSIISSQRIEEERFIHAREYLRGIGFCPERCGEYISRAIVRNAESIAEKCVIKSEKRIEKNLRIDRLITGRATAIPIMLLMLSVILFITVIGANYPSRWLSAFFGYGEILIDRAFISAGFPDFIRELVVYGVFRVTGWVIAVMLPPMAIFFPLFTLLEDAGFLPRIAFNMDCCFRCSGGCGKQALTMCMGLGCNAVGVVGCRIIESRRERLIAILTNVFVPCNGRFPTLITLISAFLVYGSVSASLLSALILCLVIICGVAVTLTTSLFLSRTLLCGMPSSFTLELPPYRVPDIPRVIVRSFLDRTLFVLGRAVSVAIPAGAIIWLMANINTGDTSLLSSVSEAIDPFASAFGLDGVILLGFILAFPANELFLSVVIMGYSGASVLTDNVSIFEMRSLLVANGWDTLKCVSVLIFCLCHFPCSTTLLTIKKETGSRLWTAAAFIIPTLVGFTLCFILNFAASLF